MKLNTKLTMDLRIRRRDKQELPRRRTRKAKVARS